MLLFQQQASNPWACCQAKLIGEHLYLSQKMRLEADLLERAGSMEGETRERIEGMLKKMAEEEARYNFFLIFRIPFFHSSTCFDGGFSGRNAKINVKK